MVKNRFIGIFSIPMWIINDRPSDVLDFMSGMIVLRAEFIPEADCIKYTAISPAHFRPVPLMESAPLYLIRLSSDGKIQIEP